MFKQIGIGAMDFEEWFWKVATAALGFISGWLWKRIDNARDLGRDNALRITAIEKDMESLAKIPERLAKLEAYGKSTNSSVKRLEAHFFRNQIPHGLGDDDEDSDN